MKNKKLIPLLLVGALVFGLAIVKLGCGVTSTGGTTTTTAPATTTTTPATTTTTAAGSFSLTSSAFTAGGTIPINNAYTNQGTGADNESVPLAWSNAPAGTNYFAIKMIDTNNGTAHWLVANIPAATSSLAENASVSGMPAGSSQITNTYTSGQYEGPYPPVSETHAYTFTIYALSSSLNTGTVVNLTTFNTAVSSNLGTATLTGNYTGR